MKLRKKRGEVKVGVEEMKYGGHLLWGEVVSLLGQIVPGD